MKPAPLILAVSLAMMTAVAPAALAQDEAAPVLVEVQPSPEEGAEWVEFANPSPTPLELEGLYLTDYDFCFAPDEGAVDEYRWPLDATVPAMDRLVVDLPEDSNCLTLADGGDKLALEDEQGRVLQSIGYGDEGALSAPDAGQSLSACHAGALVHGGWSLAAQTPGSHNQACLDDI